MGLKDDALPHGTYETPVTRRVRERMVASKSVDPDVRFATIDATHSPARDRYVAALSQQLATRLGQRLANTRDDSQRISLINQITALLDEDDLIEDEELLYGVYGAPVVEPPELPAMSLNSAHLLTNAEKDASIVHEIRREMATADSVDLLCAFIKNSGISVLDAALRDLKDRNIPFRVITSTYCGATETEAVKRLCSEYGATVHVGYESKTTKLHAKAWLFRRNSGFDTAFIGSSNLSTSALVDGIEWNVRTSAGLTPAIVEKFIATFDTYWNSPQFGPFDPARDLELLKEALKDASWKGGETKLALSSLDVRPYPYQEVMLEALAAERSVHDRHKNLLVAATGTGKTVIAALDYRSLTEANDGVPPRLLFIAHRKEILEQSLRTYREVLRRPDFGELLVDGKSPTKWQHVFASIQSLNAKRIEALSPEQFDVVVIDEFHHAEAPTYRRAISHFSPRELLGLTATPERSDGYSVAEFFDYRTAYELRLWDALQQQLLAPMHYFGVNDDTDLSGVTWRRGDYDPHELGELYVRAGDRRVRLILSEIEKKIYDLNKMKALGFCVSVKHARFMAERFQVHGVPAASITGETPMTERNKAIHDLRTGAIKVIFSVDVFNEGVDMPEANTVLLLRPTQSPTVFLQQLGRGLRLAPGKDVCTVLDFVGQQHECFDFSARFAALTNRRGKRLVAALEDEFPLLPPGTSIQLDRQVQARVLENVKKATRSTVRKLRSLAAQERTTDLAKFLYATGLENEEVYRPTGSSWTALLRHTQLIDSPATENSQESFLLKSLKKFLHVNDDQRAEAYSRLSAPHGPSYSELSPRDQIFARMMCLMFWANSNVTVPETYDDALEKIQSHPAVHDELSQLLKIQSDASRRVFRPLPSECGGDVLLSHADYARAELVAPLDNRPLPKAASLFREGVHYFDDANIDLFLVTLNKDDDSFSTTTSYRDYPLDTDLFHWESQSGTSLKSKTGQRYIHHREEGTTILLAVRATKSNSLNLASAFTLLGPVEYASHRGEKPIQFEWKLDRPMPHELYLQGRAVV